MAAASSGAPGAISRLNGHAQENPGQPGHLIPLTSGDHSTGHTPATPEITFAVTPGPHPAHTRITRWLSALRPRAEWLPRASIVLGIGATVAMNVAAGSRGGAGGALTGTLTPIGFLFSLETLILLVRKMARRSWGWVWCIGAGIPLGGLAGITGVISYLHALTVAQWTASPGEAGRTLTEHLLPLVADLMIATGSVALVALAVVGKATVQTVPETPRPPKPRKPAKSSKPPSAPAPPPGLKLVSDRERRAADKLLRLPPGTELPSALRLAKDELNNNQRASARVLAYVRAAQSERGHD